VALDPIAFQQTYVYEARAPVSEVLADLTALAGLDAVAERRRLLLWRWAWGLLGLAAAGLIIGPILVAAYLGSGNQHLWVVVGSALTAGGLFLIRRRAHRTDLDNRRYELVATLLKRLQVDLTPDAPVDVRLDLAPLDEKRKSVAKLRRGRWNCEDFTDPWLSLQGRFADGTGLHLSMVDHLQKRSRSQSSRSGKTKTKTKQKGKALLQVGLRVKPERFPELAGMESRARSIVRMPPGVQVSRLQVAGDRVSLRALMARDWVARAPRSVASTAGKQPPAPDAQDASRTATMMLLSLFQVLHFSSAPGKPGSVRTTP
jgi:hypothetical protein